MTEFNLMNGQAIELTKEGILIKGDYISLEGSITIVKNRKSASINQITDKGQLLSIVPIDDEETSKDKTIEDVTATLNDRVSNLEAKLSKAITEIDKLKTTITAERALTDMKITDAVIKVKIENGKSQTL